MAKLNMASLNTLFKKGYLLAGVMMAANMFVVNEVKATDAKEPKFETKEKEKTDKNQKGPSVPGTNIFGKVLSYENIINLFGGLAFSCVNNYFKWWDYNPGTYCKFVWFGWRSKRFLYDVVQFELNLNLVRGISWSILHVINSRMKKTSGESEKDDSFPWVGFFLKDILRGFTSMPLTFHISNFSIVISLDSILWLGIIDNIILKPSNKKGKKNKRRTKKREK